MSIFTVLDVSPEVRRFPSQYGEMVSYRLNLRNGDGTEHLNIEMVRKADSPPPVAGATFEGELENRGEKYGWKLNLAQRGGGGFGSRPEDPLRQKRIVRQHSQSMALQTVKLAHEMGIVEAAPKTGAELLDYVMKLANWFDKDVERAVS